MKVSVIIIFTCISCLCKAGISHDAFDKLLKKNVDENGMVDYISFGKDSVALNSYLKLLSENPPEEKTWTENEQKAFWINAYNAFTIQLILRNYPVKSIKEIGGDIYRINTSWDIKFIRVGDDMVDLNYIEHQKLRKLFDDPRIHFAIVCASVSCPKLQRFAYAPDNLDNQLNKAAKDFLSDTSKNKLDPAHPALSLLFKWYKMDFNNSMPLTDFINQYSDIKILSGAEINFLEYNWALNEQ